jgi:hypothetical protein
MTAKVDWDVRYMRHALEIAKWSKDRSTRFE